MLLFSYRNSYCIFRHRIFVTLRIYFIVLNLFDTNTMNFLIIIDIIYKTQANGELLLSIAHEL